MQEIWYFAISQLTPTPSPIAPTFKMSISYDRFTHKKTSWTTKLIEPPKRKNIKLDILIKPPIGRVFSLQLNPQKEITKLVEWIMEIFFSFSVSFCFSFFSQFLIERIKVPQRNKKGTWLERFHISSIHSRPGEWGVYR